MAKFPLKALVLSCVFTAATLSAAPPLNPSVIRRDIAKSRAIRIAPVHAYQAKRVMV